jgi:phospholipid/cholesterol/gamma-HCH transport system substrate-binding protein
VRGLLSPLIKLIVFLVITTLATYVLAVTIANSSYGATYSYKADFTDVTGLELGDDVRIAGVRVGTVTGIHISKQDDGRAASLAKVDFTVQKSRRLPTSVTAAIHYRNLIGQRYIDVAEGAGNPGGLLKPGGTVRNTSAAVDLTLLFQGFKPLTEGLDATELNKLSLDIINTLQGEGGALTSLFGTLADLTNTLADKDQVIGDLIDNLSGVLTAVGQRDQELTQLVIQLKNFVSGLAQDRTTIGNAIDGINQLATSTTGLLTQVRGPLAQDVKDLTGLVANLNDNSSTVKYVVQQLAPTVAGLIRTASYGSWFNFYLCSVSGNLSLGSGSSALNLISPGLTLAGNAQARCK